MTTLLQKAIAQVEKLSRAEQDRAAETLLAVTTLSRRGAYKLSSSERVSVRRGIKEMRAGKLAGSGRVQKVYDKYR